MIPALVVVIAAAAAAFFYPAYQPMLPIHFTMDANEAHLMGVYLLVIGFIFLWLTRPRRPKAPTITPPPLAKD